MNSFPGSNELKLSKEALMAILREHVQGKLGADVRITDVSMGSYGSSYAIDFTTDPAPATEPEGDGQ